VTDNAPDRSAVPPQRPAKRRFAGTPAQIRSALTFYKVTSYITGIMLLLLCAEMVLRYGFNLFLFANATNTLTGETFALGLAQAEPSVIEGVNLSIAVLVAHGWLYVLYLIADFRLWSLMRWPFTRFVLIALGGVIPFLSIILERKVHREVEEELAAHPEAVKRY
jgi:integral membrane protein